MRSYRRLGRATFLLALLLGLFFSQIAEAVEKVRVGVLRFGTVNWELDTIRHHGIDNKYNIDLDVRFFASEDATNVAMMAGDVDIIVADWLWVSRQRASGEDISFAAYSSSVGALMVRDGSPIKKLADLNGKKIGVAGGPLDKSWLLIQALAKKQALDLPAQNEIVFGAPPLLAEKAEQGELDAILNFWNFCARLEARGFHRLISTSDAARDLGATGAVSAIGFIFREKWARDHPELIEAFLKASRDAKKLLAISDEEWQRLSPVIKAEGRELQVLRDRYREGIPRRSVEEEEEDAAKLYAILAELGGERLVGPGKTLAPGTFWRTQ